MLRQNLFTKKEEHKATRDGFGEGLLEAGKIHKNVVALCADLTESTKMNAFREAFPDRFFEVGITEQSMSGVAAGLSSMGYKAFMASYAMFSPGRNWEQIRTSIAYNNQSVVVVGAHSGLSVGPDGATHQALEDISLMCVMPNMTVFNPLDSNEAKAITLYLAESKSPSYIRLAREPSPLILSDDYNFVPGKMVIIDSPKKEYAKNIGILVTGPIGYEALKAVKEINKHNIGVTVVNVSTLKPFDTKFLLRFAKSVSAIITVEEHQLHGGLHSLVSSTLSIHHPMKVVPIAVQDSFGESGKRDELYNQHGLSSEYIVDVALNLL